MPGLPISEPVFESPVGVPRVPVGIVMVTVVEVGVDLNRACSAAWDISATGQNNCPLPYSDSLLSLSVEHTEIKDNRQVKAEANFIIPNECIYLW